MKIRSYNKTYEVETVSELSIAALKGDSKVFIMADKKVFDLYKDSVFNGIEESDVFLFDAVEENKNIDCALKICKGMVEKGIRRSDTLLSIGGGIVQDVSGLAAHLYNRGMNWTFIPTTLLAQCDSCIGGKTSLNFGEYKNLLGTFYAPDKIYIYTEFLKTLTQDDYLSGVGEVAKFNIMSEKEGIELLEDKMEKILARDNETSEFLIKRSLEFKKGFIEEDEFDKGRRNLLNFAHTFGHAFESASNYKIPHGQAVTLGMMMANDISVRRGMLDKKIKERVENICLKFVSVKIHKQYFELDAIIEPMKKDKKRKTERLAVVLLCSDFSLVVVQDINESEVSISLNNLKATIFGQHDEDKVSD